MEYIMQLAEKRKLTRKPVAAELEIFSKETRENLGKGFITNLHEDGLCFVTPENLDLGQELLFNFKLPNSWKFDFFGKIVHAGKGVSTMFYGAQFSPGQSTFIFDIV